MFFTKRLHRDKQHLPHIHVHVGPQLLDDVVDPLLRSLSGKYTQGRSSNNILDSIMACSLLEGCLPGHVQLCRFSLLVLLPESTEDEGG